MKVFSEHIFDGICQGFKDAGDKRVITKAVLCFECIEEDGNEGHGVVATPGTSPHQGFGLLEAGRIYLERCEIENGEEVFLDER